MASIKILFLHPLICSLAAPIFLFWISSSQSADRKPAVENQISIELEGQNQKTAPAHPGKQAFPFPANSQKGADSGMQMKIIEVDKVPHTTNQDGNSAAKNIFLIIFLIIIPFTISYAITYKLPSPHQDKEEPQDSTDTESPVEEPLKNLIDHPTKKAEQGNEQGNKEKEEKEKKKGIPRAS